MPGRAARAQSSIDFISSYGFVILIIAVVIYAVLQLGVFNYSASPPYCYPQSPFSCMAYSINTSGAIAIVLSQSSGGILNITGAACSTSPNTTRVGPRYGNVKVLPYGAAPPGAYPNGGLANGMVLYPGQRAALQVECYGSNLGPARSSLGQTFTGYVWVNYTFSGLPSGYHNLAQAAAVNIKYT